MVIHRHVQAIPADAFVPVHITESAGDAMTEARDPSEFLGIEVEQIALVAHVHSAGSWGRRQAAAP